ncbi:MAG TPA: substrate-binding domain-containing protein [Xanthobacteraceae bacterium]|nr:substrate-binding domain-containing protein [Xanthobacteraceae bacterium]
MQLHILSGGAAEGLVHTLAPQFRAATGFDIQGTFGAVGAQRDKLLAGQPADILILTSALISDLTKAGHVAAGSAADLGVVRTGIAVQTGTPHPAIGNADELRAALLAADEIYLPDPKLATAGIHFAKVIAALGASEAVAGRLRVFPNGTTAMGTMAAASGRPLGCTQATEILNTSGVDFVGPLPAPFELATTYTAALCSRSQSADAARQFISLLTDDGTREIRARMGFGSSNQK